jgi:hypothetical protein
MTAKEYLEKLKPLVEANPDLEVITARDDEGNGYNPVVFDPSIGYFDNTDYDSTNEDANVLCLN